VYVYVCVYIYICISRYVCINIHISLYCMYVQFVSFSIGEWGWGSSTSLWKRLLLGVVGYFWRKERYRCCLCLFYAGGSVCGCVCVYTHTHTHTAQMGYLDVSPGVRMRHLEGPKNPDGLNLGIRIFVYVYEVHMCIYILKGGMRSWTECFFLLTCLFFWEK